MKWNLFTVMVTTIGMPVFAEDVGSVDDKRLQKI
jgi:hypothetical protein